LEEQHNDVAKARKHAKMATSPIASAEEWIWNRDPFRDWAVPKSDESKKHPRVCIATSTENNLQLHQPSQALTTAGGLSAWGRARAAAGWRQKVHLEVALQR